jgi:hypothetical protein
MMVLTTSVTTTTWMGTMFTDTTVTCTDVASLLSVLV